MTEGCPAEITLVEAPVLLATGDGEPTPGAPASALDLGVDLWVGNYQWGKEIGTFNTGYSVGHCLYLCVYDLRWERLKNSHIVAPVTAPFQRLAIDLSSADMHERAT